MTPTEFQALRDRVEQTESGGNPNAVSPKGAVGTMQTLPTTLADPGYGVTPAKDSSAAERKRVGNDYLRAMVDKYGNPRDALVAYNWGPGNANDWIAAGRDPRLLPQETQAYLAKIAPPTQETVDAQLDGKAPLDPKQIPTQFHQDFRGRDIVDLGHGVVAGQAVASQNASQEVVRPPPQGKPSGEVYTYNVNGTTFTVEGASSREDGAQALADHIDEHPGAVADQAVKQGLKYDPKTNSATEYGTIDKFMIGYGKVINDGVQGVDQLLNTAAGNWDAVQKSHEQTDAEKALYDHLNTPGHLDAADVGEVGAMLPLIFGPGGIVGFAARSGLFGAVKAEGTDATSTSRLTTGAGDAALAAAAGVAGLAPTTLYKVLKGIGAKQLARTAGTALADTMMTGGFATASNLGALVIKAGKAVAKKNQVAGRGPGTFAWDRSGSTATDPGYAAASYASKFLSDIGHELKDGAAGKILDVMKNLKNPSDATQATEVLIQNLTKTFEAGAKEDK